MNSKYICLSVLALAALLAAPPLRAGDSKWSFGAQAGMVAPIGAISGIASTGFDLSLFAERRASGKTAESFGIDYTTMGGKDFGFEAIGGDVVYDTTLNFRASYLNIMWNTYYGFDSNDHGPYLMHGFGVGFCSFTPESGAGTSAFTCPLAAGFGYNLGRNYGLEAKYVLTAARRDYSLRRGPFGDAEVSKWAQFFKLGVRYRF